MVNHPDLLTPTRIVAIAATDHMARREGFRAVVPCVERLRGFQLGEQRWDCASATLTTNQRL
jgi:hypothetical protein